MKMDRYFRIKIWIGLLIAVLSLFSLFQSYGLKSSGKAVWSDSIIQMRGKWAVDFEEEGGDWEYRYKIPEGMDGPLCFSMKAYFQEFQIFLDEEPLYSFSDVYGIQGRSRHLLRLPGDAPGKTLILRAKNVDFSEGKAGADSASIGRENEVLIMLLLNNLYALVFGVFTFLLGGVSLAAAIFMRKKVRTELRSGLLCLSAFVFVAGIWVVTDSELLLFLTDKLAVVSLISFVTFMLMPFFLLRFVGCMLGERKSLNLLEVLFGTMVILYLINYLVLVVPGYFLLLPVHLLCFCAIVLALRIGYREMKEHKSKTAQIILGGFLMLSIFCVAAFILFYINPTIFPYAVIYCAGIFLFILFLLRVTFDKLHEQMEKAASIAAYRELAYMDVMTGMENRTAFMEEQNRGSLAAGTVYVLLDINNLKIINDQYGHQAGDQLIILAAHYIRDAFGSLGKCYRIGGDEFMAVLQNSSGESTREMIAGMQERIRRENERRKVPLSIAAGYAVQERAGDTPEQLYRWADASMYEEKQRMKRECL